MPHPLIHILDELQQQDGVVAAALFGTDGLVIDCVGCENIEYDRIAALLATYNNIVHHRPKTIRILKLPKKERISYIAVIVIQDAILAIMTEGDKTPSCIAAYLQTCLEQIYDAMMDDVSLHREKKENKCHEQTAM